MNKQILSALVKIYQNIITHFLFFFLIITLLIFKSSFAADIYEDMARSKKGSYYHLIVIEGTIVKGDYNKFQNTVKRLIDSENYVNSVQLDSKGGDVLEAMKIGRLIRKLHINTIAPFNWDDDTLLCFGNRKKLKNAPDACVCSSSCFLIWAGGVVRGGSYLNVHRPYFSKEYFKGLSVEKAKKKYRLLSNDVKIYLKDMDIPTQVIEEMFQYSSNEIRTLDENTVKSMHWAPFYQEWIIANCERKLTQEEMIDWIKLGEKKGDQGLTKAEQFYRNNLVKRWNKHNKCTAQKRHEIQYEALK